MTAKKGLRPLASKYGRRWVVFDTVLGFIAMRVSLSLSPYVDVYYAANQIFVSIAFGFILAGCLRLAGLNTHRFEHVFSYYEIIISTIIGTVAAFLIVSLAVTFTHVHVFGRYVVIGTLLISSLGIITQRSLVKLFLGKSPIKLFLLGSTPAALKLIERVHGDKHFHLVGVACSDFQDEDTPKTATVEYQIEDPISLCKYVKNNDVDLVVSCYGEQVPEAICQAIEKMPFYGIDVINKGYFVETYFREISVEFQNYHWLTSHSFRPTEESHLVLKRGFDIAFGALIALLILPLFPLFAFIIKLDSKGPVFYTQTRVGYLGRPFKIIKFRSMRTDAETDGAVWATQKDPRVTRWGNFMRRTRIDELPQIWNVLKGEMSLIGPRPERPEFVEELKKEIPLYEWRYLIPPGLTGWAQIRYKYGSTVEDAKRKLQYDLYYIKRASIALEIQILLQTIPLIMKGSR
ncbi:MAG: sugar transferase [Opitutales bacterium]|nr:sugar transferase [Opitutales bacterium]